MSKLFKWVIFFGIISILAWLGFWLNGRFFDEGSFLNSIIVLLGFCMWPLFFIILYDLSKQKDNDIEMNIKNIFMYVFVYGTIGGIILGFITGML